MAKRKAKHNGFDRRYCWREYPLPHQHELALEQSLLLDELWNALLEIDRIIRDAKVWFFDRAASGPLIFDLAGNLHEVALGDVLMRRRILGQRRFSMREIIHARPAGESRRDVKAGRLDIHGFTRPAGTEAGDVGSVVEQRWRIPSEFDRGYWISRLRADCPEWRDLSTWTPRRRVTDLAKAWDHFFTPGAKRIPGRRYGEPRFKRLGANPTIPHRFASGCRIEKSDRHPKSWWIHLAGIGKIWARGQLPRDVSRWTDSEMRLRDGKWEFSAAVVMPPRREPCGRGVPVMVRFDYIDAFALVNGEPVMPAGLLAARDLDDQRAAMQSAFDLKWPRDRRWSDEQWRERCEEKAAIGRLASRIARIRRDALHVLTAGIVRRAGDNIITIVVPPSIKDATASAKGDEKNWGAEVKTVAAINRHVLNQAPALARQMLEYKAAEAGIRCDVVIDEAPSTVIGREMSKAARKIRQVNRKVRRQADGK